MAAEWVFKNATVIGKFVSSRKEDLVIFFSTVYYSLLEIVVYLFHNMVDMMVLYLCLQMRPLSQEIYTLPQHLSVLK
jgi:hypothetical protein